MKLSCDETPFFHDLLLMLGGRYGIGALEMEGRDHKGLLICPGLGKAIGS